MTLKNNRAHFLSNIKHCASLHHHMWIQTGITVRKQLSGAITSVTLTFDLTWQKHSEKGDRQTDRQTDGQTDGRTDRRTERSVLRVAWSKLKIVNISIKICSHLSHKSHFVTCVKLCLGNYIMAISLRRQVFPGFSWQPYSTHCSIFRSGNNWMPIQRCTVCL